MKALEAFFGSFGIFLFGFISIPFVGATFGVNMTNAQGAKMGIAFFVLRFMWLYLCRHIFEWIKLLRRKPP